MPNLRSKRIVVGAAFLGALGLAGTALAGGPVADPTPPAKSEPARAVAFPGAAPWKQVPLSRVAQECGLDPALLKKAAPKMALSPYAIIRYGKLCASGGDL